MSVLDVLYSQSATLIRDEVRAAASRSALERGIRQAVNVYGYTVDEASAGSGLTPDEIRSILAQVEPLSDDLADLAGNR